MNYFEIATDMTLTAGFLLSGHIVLSGQVYPQSPYHGATRWWRNHDASFLRFDTIPARDRHTDGQTRYDRYTRASIVSRG